MKNLLLIFVLLFSVGCSTDKNVAVKQKDYYAKPVAGFSLQNLHKVDEKLYRSAQPSAQEFQELYKLGIRYDLNLRQWHNDKDKLKSIRNLIKC